jgi:pimeloyl-ACP methyl ester carboxylesterase
MFFAPFPLLFSWLFGLASLALLGGGLYLLWAWYVGWLVGTGVLVGGLAMTAWSFFGRWVVLLFRRTGLDEPKDLRPDSILRLERPDGTVLSVATYGAVGAPTLVLTHGAGVNASSWYYVQRKLAERFRVVCWDLPGLGRSGRPNDGNFSLERHAEHLAAVVDATATNRPVVLVGHSLGGMITLTFCRLFPERLGPVAAGLVLVDSSHTNPTRTTTASGFVSAIQKPILEPVLHLIRWLAPLVWLTSWLSYLNGTAHLGAMLFGFAGSETRGQLDRAALYNPLAWPGVQAAETLAMLDYDATPTLSAIPVPVLCLTGHLDRMVVPATSRFMAEQIPAGRAHVLQPGGHMTVFEREQDVTQALAQFADEVIGSQALSRAS